MPEIFVLSMPHKSNPLHHNASAEQCVSRLSPQLNGGYAALEERGDGSATVNWSCLGYCDEGSTCKMNPRLRRNGSIFLK